ncbi:hypothetical protein SAMN02745157_0717 [Kaistia soli DSM 19436]|uniref:Uncharacterized protein n=1 Tax=Kaistia soli DSM 19436 TaxID=1122133 RepID=A0A1M4VJ86_9HYPH|nr:hypothetical protein [Kaistia soli]SHE68935.1 hypothetical protein SAMN02745157_0717 [Kaistia soli DSM 19436]
MTPEWIVTALVAPAAVAMAAAIRLLWTRLNEVQDKRIAEQREALTIMKASTDAAVAVADGQEAVTRGLDALRAAIERKGAR